MRATPYYIRAAIRNKAEAPFATAANNAMKKAQKKLVKLYGGDTLMITYSDANDQALNLSMASEALQEKKAIIMRMVHEVRAPDRSNFLDEGEYKVMGELVVQLPASSH